MARTPYRVGEWLPSDHAALHGWITRRMRDADAGEGPLHPSVQAFKNLIETDPVIYMLFTQMFQEIPRARRYDRDPTGLPRARDYHQMLRLLDNILTRAPAFNETAMVGCPINAIFGWVMATPSGHAAFVHPRVNGCLRDILNEWARFLASEASAHVLNDDPREGWFGEDARKAMPDFDLEYECDPGADHHGFRSWDDFFTRRFRPGVRPVAAPDDDRVLVNACESAPFRLTHGVKHEDRFWIKAQPYSLRHMLADDVMARRFAGATVYQAYLSGLSYHRWHSPAGGRIVRIRMLEGIYFSEVLAEGFDPEGPNRSQAYLTEVAERALIFIEPDCSDIGLICVMFVGMTEVSGCEITVTEGQMVRKGDELGMFHFGGSTWCMILGPGVDARFDLRGQTPGLHARNIPVNAEIARIAPA